MTFPNLLAAALAGCLAAAAQSPAVRIRLEAGAFVADGSGVGEALRSESPDLLLRIFVQGSPPDSPPVAGEYERRPDALAFRPRYPLQPGAAYRVQWRQEPPAVLSIPAAASGPAAFVERVYPTSDTLPENQLKFYIHFSAPMSRGEAYRRIHLIEDGGAPVSLPFLELDEELWDRAGRRFTILFDPGRIKRGVLPREEVGSALQPGKRYTLVIDRGWADASGSPLRDEFRKSFSVRESDRTPLDASRFRVTAPAAGTRETLALDFGEPVDSALALRLVEVTDPRSLPVDGVPSLDRQESRWLFTPSGPWMPGRYSIQIAATLEDLAGNRIGRAFDVDRFDQVDRHAEPPKKIALPFRITAPSRSTPAGPTPK